METRSRNVLYKNLLGAHACHMRRCCNYCESSSLRGEKLSSICSTQRPIQNMSDRSLYVLGRKEAEGQFTVHSDSLPDVIYFKYVSHRSSIIPKEMTTNTVNKM